MSADVVTADGALVTCSDSLNEDLYWAIRGGGGNFGIVTSFEYRLHPVADIFGGPMFYPLDGNVLRAFSEFICDAPEELGAIFAFTLAPPLPFIPADWHGRPVAAVVACWTGPLEDGDKALAPLKDFGRVVGAYVGRMPYPAINTLFDGLLPSGLQQYWKANFVRDITDRAIAAHLEHAAKVPSVESGTFLLPIDGACRRVSPEETAFANRNGGFSGLIAGAWGDPADNEANVRWVRDYYEALRPYSEQAGYVNFMSGDDQNLVRENYGRNYDRLVEIKSKYDPTNVFHLNQNIKPKDQDVIRV
jgi:FAD/FMN-containing dehydrogenase